MFKKTQVCTGVLVALGGALLATSAPVLAQTAERIEITGSRIRSLNGTSISPIQSLSEAEINSTQPVAVEEVIRGLPAAIPAIGPGTNNGSGGGATVDLRGLGPNRTLVLVNGRRFVPFDLNAVVDTNNIPIALLQRVDVFTGGASAAYGADAVSGVINFILKKNFSGVDLTTSYGVSEKGDTKKRRTDFTIGANSADGRGNAVLSIGTTRSDPLRQGERTYGESAISSTSGRPSGSFTTVPGYFDSAFISGQIVPSTGALNEDAQTYNFNPLNYYQTGLNRQQATALASYTINDYVQVYAEGTYTRSNVNSTLAPSGTFFNTFSVPIGNPYIQPATRAIICAAYSISPANCVAGAGGTTEFDVDIGRRFVEFGPRLNDFKNKTYQATAGVKGSFLQNWGYDAYLSRGESDQFQIRGNWGSSSKVQQALRATNTTTCLDSSNGCVPLNVFGAEGSITPAQQKFVNLDALLSQSVQQDIVSAFVTGDLGSIKSPMSKQPIGLVFGYENRKLTTGQKSDSASQINGEVLGTGAAVIDVVGSFELNEFYTEARIPLLENLPFARSLNLELGYRHSQFKVASSKTDYGSWKYGGDWEPVKGFRVRAVGQRATRSPNISELFLPTTTGLDNLAVDPCQGTNINAADVGRAGTLTNLCVLTGVPASRVGSLPTPSAGQVNVLSGGNPNLSPEIADTYSVGFVFEPDFVPGLTVSVDYYNIELTKAISNPSVTDVLNSCYSPTLNPGLGVSAGCAAIGRGPGGTFNGSSSPGIQLPVSNLGKLATSGIDLAASYRLPLRNVGLSPALGVVDLGLNVTYVDKLEYQATPSSVNRDCLGYYSVACASVNGNGNPFNRVKFAQRASWNVGDFRVGYNWRHLSSVEEEPGGTNFLPAFARIKSFNYVDLNGTWNVTKNVALNLSVNNAFDKKPPEVGNTIGSTTANSGNTFPQTYDVVGRYYTVGASIKF
ncbi:MAG: TonB-dependent receptor [Rubrivivax sp.]